MTTFLQKLGAASLCFILGALCCVFLGWLLSFTISEEAASTAISVVPLAGIGCAIAGWKSKSNPSREVQNTTSKSETIASAMQQSIDEGQLNEETITNFKQKLYGDDFHKIEAFTNQLKIIGLLSNSSAAFKKCIPIIMKDLKPGCPWLNSSKSMEVVACSVMSNISGDFVESGELHLYRGILNSFGEDMLELYIVSVTLLVELGEISQSFADQEVSNIKNNILTVG